MSLMSRAIHAFEAAPLPDGVRRGAISMLVSRAAPRFVGGQNVETLFADAMSARAIAEHTADANKQHYEVPTDFFRACLGPHLKYSCCYFDSAQSSLAQAEERALSETCAHADLHNGHDILELGCGWGSLTLFMAARYPAARITTVSNSATQRAHIMAEAAARKLRNVTVITADMNAFDTADRFDRIVSVEMFEHMSNWRALLTRCRAWLRPDGLMMMHVFAHQSAPYRFDVADRNDWVAQHFFSGGIMPSRNLIRAFPDLFAVDQEWWWSGRHYERTANAWLENFDAQLATIRRLLRETYGRDARLWEHRWRLFFLVTAGLFGHGGGDVWGVVHHRLRPVT